MINQRPHHIGADLQCIFQNDQLTCSGDRWQCSLIKVNNNISEVINFGRDKVGSLYGAKSGIDQEVSNALG